MLLHGVHCVRAGTHALTDVFRGPIYLSTVSEPHDLSISSTVVYALLTSGQIFEYSLYSVALLLVLSCT